jgi:hypothetical protein
VYDALTGKNKDYADEQVVFILSEKRDWIQAYEAFLAARAAVLVSASAQHIFETRMSGRRIDHPADFHLKLTSSYPSSLYSQQ